MKYTVYIQKLRIQMKPIRMCIACRKRFPKEELLRIVNKDGTLKIDIIQKEQCRGVYLCLSSECVERAIKIKALVRAMKTEVPNELYNQIRSYAGNSHES